jgi:hypothetical protein
MSDRVLTPQQELFLSYYTDPKSETFSNATQSAIKAGYEQSYADNIMALLPDWLSENIGDMRRLRKAEKNLEEVQNLEIKDPNTGRVDPQLVEKRTKVDIFLAERLGKDKYSPRQEVTGKGGKDLIPDKQSKEKADEAINTFLNNGSNQGNTGQGESQGTSSPV